MTSQKTCSKTYKEIVQEIESRGIMPDRPPSLSPMKEALEALIPHSFLDPKKTIIVAGTNGKGSICATLEALFLAAGESVGLYTSPHLEETTERIRINGKDIDQDLFCQAYRKVVEKTKDRKLSHFEILTLMAAWVFYSGESIPPVSRPIFEVGLGGTWDATNAIPHQNCVIASLNYDHQNLLGNSLEEIASNKFGIVEPGAIVVHSPLPSEVIPLAQKVQAMTQSRWVPCAPFTLKVETSENHPRFTLQTQWGEALLSMPGQRAAQNAATALTLFQALGYSPESYLSALVHVRWPGRMERIDHPQSPCPLYLSGDHNPAGSQSLLELLPYFPRRHLYILIGIGKDKDADGILSPLFKLEKTSIFLTVTPFRGRSLDDYGTWRSKACGLYSDPLHGLQQIVSQAKKGDLILVTGSLYLVGLIRSTRLLPAN